jgi:molybdopterin synthase catalytic subunit
MRRLAEEARRGWRISRIVMLHRIGRVEVGQPSVLIAVSTPHRAEAFEACRFLIDRLKAEATIWKKEIWSDRSSTWVEGHGRQS